MLKKIAIIFGSIFLLLGIMGFIPGLTPHGDLVGIFSVNAVHNFVHLGTGIAALISGLISERAARIFFAIFGIIYGLVTIVGFIEGEGLLFGIMAINTADNWLHLVISLVSLYLAFAFKGDRTQSE